MNEYKGGDTSTCHPRMLLEILIYGYLNNIYCGNACPSDHSSGRTFQTSDAGYESEVSVYRAKNCQGCPLRKQCHKAQGNRSIELNHKLFRYKKKVRELLMSQEGLKYRSKRPVEVQAVFGQLKKNRMFNRFKMRGMKKGEVEFGMLVFVSPDSCCKLRISL